MMLDKKTHSIHSYKGTHILCEVAFISSFLPASSLINDHKLGMQKTIKYRKKALALLTHGYSSDRHARTINKQQNSLLSHPNRCFSMPEERGNTFFEGLRKQIGSTAIPNNSSINSTASQNGFISRYLSNIYASDWLRVEEALWYVHFNDQDFLIYATGLSQAVAILSLGGQTFLTGILIRM